METQKIVRLSLLASVATVLSVLENQLPIPRPPWLKLGLANVVTLIALEIYGIRFAIAVACVRSLLAGIFGTLPMLIFSFSAALSSSTVMGILHRVSAGRLSIVGISVFGAVVHNLTQLLVAYLVLRLNCFSLLAIAPVLILSAVLACIVTGLIAKYVISKL